MYTKIFQKIFTSTIWGESRDTKLLWLTMLIAMDEDGYIEASSTTDLAALARMPEADVIEALKPLESPDLKTEQPHKGVRTIRVPGGGWYVLNATKYRDIKTREDQRDENMARVDKAILANPQLGLDLKVTTFPKCDHISGSAVYESSSNCDNSDQILERDKAKPKCQSDVESEAKVMGMPNVEAAKFWDFYESKGWKVGRNPMKSWRAALRNWFRGWKERNPHFKPPAVKIGNPAPLLLGSPSSKHDCALLLSEIKTANRGSLRFKEAFSKILKEGNDDVIKIVNERYKTELEAFHNG